MAEDPTVDGEWNDVDSQHIWHPYSSMPASIPSYVVESAHGSLIRIRRDGREGHPGRLSNSSPDKTSAEDVVDVVDGMSSWWACIHGYNHPELNRAVQNQLANMSHVMFGGLTHQPALRLTQKLIEMTPASLQHVFYCDSGSVAVEVAMKMALQYHQSCPTESCGLSTTCTTTSTSATCSTTTSSTSGKPRKHKFLTFRGGYHGDTFLAMSVCDPINGMHQLFQSILPQQYFVSRPSVPYATNNTNNTNNTNIHSQLHPFDPLQHLAEIRHVLEHHHEDIAAFILEPVVQGAGGMHFYSPQYLPHIRRLCDEYNVLMIADEIATGFGRLGCLRPPADLPIISENSANTHINHNTHNTSHISNQPAYWAFQHAPGYDTAVPDILCIGKALSGGYMSFAAVIANTKVADAFRPQDGTAAHHKHKTMGRNVLMHGPTFMGNPLACAVSLASIDLLQRSNWPQRVFDIEHQLREELQPAMESTDTVHDVRVLGAIGVIEMKNPIDIRKVQSNLIHNHNVWLRPFGKLLYTMPPFNNITTCQLRQITKAMVAVALHKP